MAFHVVIDCSDPKSLAVFWARALYYEHILDLDNYSVIVDGKRVEGGKEASSPDNEVHTYQIGPWRDHRTVTTSAT